MNVLEIKKGIVNYVNSSKELLDVTINIQKNDLCLFVGKNGCGKTTFFDVIIGFRQFEKQVEYIKKFNSVGYCVQDFNGALLPWLTIFNNIVLPARLLKQSESVDETAVSLLKKFGLINQKHSYPYQLSGGQKQVVNIIRTLCTPCEILLFDEPFSSLHIDNRKIAIELINEIKLNKTVLIISHSLDDLEMLELNRYFSIENKSIVERSKAEVSHLLKYFHEE